MKAMFNNAKRKITCKIIMFLLSIFFYKKQNDNIKHLFMITSCMTFELLIFSFNLLMLNTFIDPKPWNLCYSGKHKMTFKDII